MEKTYVLKGKQEPNWVLVDATDQTLGRMTTLIASYLLGKHKPTFTPGVDMGDAVVVINVSKMRVSQKRLDDKMYHRVSGYPGGITSIRMRDQLAKYPDRVIQHAVWGMLPHNKLGRKLLKRLKVYAGNEHPHEAQNPTAIV
ncbi:MAG TPA: 50S ribosomal protein L13 [Anaerolineaceae bacterium]|nr:50S ribosomal protein L13 [Anaerolineaceae bacterium]HQN04412.1 50S ribosomal protein L13 [Anaerolineaceae bacterium]HQP08319.1 50S ribosomal protein L13 [Anaerolineaceae bacterium]